MTLQPNTQQQLHIDSFFTQGKNHAVCEDYALTGTSPCPFFLITDGCGSARFADMSARLLAWTFRAKVTDLQQAIINGNQQAIIDFPVSLVKQAKLAATTISFREDLLATLLFGLVVNGKIHVFAYGDGCIVTRDNSNNLKYHYINYLHNAPFYPYYLYDNHCRDMYEEQFCKISNHGKLIKTVTCQPGERKTRLENKSHTTVEHFCFALDEYAFIGVMSDGINTFTKANHGQHVLLHDAIVEMTAFKTVQGEFIKRRCNKALKNYGKAGLFPGDDLAIAGLVIETIDK